MFIDKALSAAPFELPATTAKQSSINPALLKPLPALQALPSFPHPPLPDTFEASDLETWLYRHFDSSQRLSALLDVWGYDYLESEEVLELLGVIWTSCDSVSHERTRLNSLFTADSSHVKYFMMSKREWNAFDKLPETVTVYRGCSAASPNGLSWSLDKSIAKKFPFYLRHRVSDPALVTATVKKDDILAVKHGRGEREIVTNKVTILSIKTLPIPKKKKSAEAFTPGLFAVLLNEADHCVA